MYYRTTTISEATVLLKIVSRLHRHCVHCSHQLSLCMWIRWRTKPARPTAVVQTGSWLSKKILWFTKMVLDPHGLILTKRSNVCRNIAIIMWSVCNQIVYFTKWNCTVQNILTKISHIWFHMWNCFSTCEVLQCHTRNNTNFTCETDTFSPYMILSFHMWKNMWNANFICENWSQCHMEVHNVIWNEKCSNSISNFRCEIICEFFAKGMVVKYKESY